MRVIAMNPGPKPLSGIAFAVIFAGAILFLSGFRHERNDLGTLRMDEDGIE
jgi:hypothetical protein